MSESIATTDIRASEEGRDAAESQEPQQGYSEDQEIFSEGVSGPTVAGMVVSGSSLVSAEEDKAGDNKNISSTTPLSDGNNAPDSSRIGSPYIRFGGYVDEQGVVHDHEEADNSSPNDQEIKVQITPKDNGEEDGEDANTSTVEEVLEASQNFALSHPGRRFSSSLENLYSSSQRQLYPSLEDANDIPDLSPSKLPKSQQQKERKAPEPPATDDEEEEEEEEEDVKIGVASSSSEQFTPAYAYASATASEETNNFDGPMHAYASAAESESSPVYAVASLGDISTSTTEATVLETARTPEEVLLEKLEKEDAELAAMKRAAYYGESNRCGCSATTTASSFSAQHPSATNVADERATVVEITEHFVHPSDISNDAVTAELIGEDYNNVSSIGASRQVATPQQTTATGQAVMTVDDSIVNTSEATIIEQQTDWHPPHTEEAVVINGDTSSDAYLERKPAATPTNNASYEWGYPQNVVPTDSVVEDRSATSDNGEARVAFADEVGEIVGISEEFHPDEVPDDEAEAELVGEDYSCAVAVPQMGARETMSSVQSTNNEVQTAMVVGYEDNEGAIDGEIPTARAFSYSSPSAAEPMTPPSRAYSAPSTRQRDQGEGTDNAHITQEAVSEPTAATDEDWMRAPSLGGSSSDQGVTIMQPPNAEENTAVHVATLPAAAPSPSAGANANSCFVEDPANPPSQPEIPVASLNAFASAPFQPEADETDCHAMAMLRQQHSSMDATSEGSSITEPVDIPPPRSFNSTIGASEGVAGSGSVCSSTSNRLQTKISSSLARGMELLFGESKPAGERVLFDNDTAAKFVVPRTLLPWSVIYSEATGMWVATVNTNQKALESKNVVEASKSLRAFSVVSEKQATCLALAWSPPKMHPFSKNLACHICKSKFAVFRRACHCRNCGVCICTSCAVPWPSKMLPETMNLKQESFLNICKSCDWLCTSFRLALLEGDLDKAIALHATGNVNMVTPFANVKGELFYPVHCAVLGGNLAILKWLVDDNCCPIKSVRVSGRCRDSSNSFTEISTSKGRSLLGIAMENRNVGIIRYLVVEKGIQLSGEKDITMDTLCKNLDLVLRLLPEEATKNIGNADGEGFHLAALLAEESPSVREARSSNSHEMRAMNDSASDASLIDACIICFDAAINCVAAPCGHQVCCLECSKNINRCPVCAVECSFMRVFRP